MKILSFLLIATLLLACKPAIQVQSDNRATIGCGYTFNRNNNVEIWRNSGIELTPEQWQTLATIDAAPVAGMVSCISG